MEDEGFVDDEFIEETAWDYYARHGGECVAILRRQAEAAAAAGDEVSAQTWRAVLEAAEGIAGVV